MRVNLAQRAVRTCAEGIQNLGPLQTECRTLAQTKINSSLVQKPDPTCLCQKGLPGLRLQIIDTSCERLRASGQALRLSSGHLNPDQGHCTLLIANCSSRITHHIRLQADNVDAAKEQETGELRQVSDGSHIRSGDVDPCVAG